jgi:hypothetical protein
MSVNETQVGGDHYKQMGVQPWEAMEAWLSPAQFRGFLLGSAIAYLARVNTKGVDGKGGIQDIKKARHYLDKIIEIEEGKAKQRDVGAPTENAQG